MGTSLRSLAAFSVAVSALVTPAGVGPLAEPGPAPGALDGDAWTLRSTAGGPPQAGPAPELLSNSRQHVVAVVETPRSTTGRLYRYQMTDGEWRPVGEGVPIVVGSNGVGPKREGDGRSPQGVFPLGFAFGYAEEPPVRTELTYRYLPPESVCVDDPGSTSYNQILLAPDRQPDWESAEAMRRDLAHGDELYSLGVTVGYNPGAVPGAGSCIFLHVWRSANSPTAGCTAMAERDLRTLVGWLEPRHEPVLIQGSRTYLEDLRSRGSLPYPVPVRD